MSTLRIAAIDDAHLDCRGGAGDSTRARRIRHGDFIAAFEWTVRSIIERHKVEPFDVVALLGDLFDSVSPSNMARREAARILGLLREAGIEQDQVLMIPGNHDKPRHAGTVAPYEELEEAGLVTVLENSWTYFVVGGGRLTIFGASQSMTADDWAAAVKESEEVQDDKTRTVLLAHGVFAGHSMASLVEADVPDVREHFDLTLLGHYHDLTDLGKRAYYTGSLESTSIGEDPSKFWLEFSLTEEKEVMTRHPIPTRPRHEQTINADGLTASQLAEVIVNNAECLSIEGEDIVVLRINNLDPAVPFDKAEAAALYGDALVHILIDYAEEGRAEGDQPQDGPRGIEALDVELERYLVEHGERYLPAGADLEQLEAVVREQAAKVLDTKEVA